MNEEDVQLDYYPFGPFLLSVSEVFIPVWPSTSGRRKKEKAVEVLDRCMDLAPSRVLPFDQYISGITIPGRDGEAYSS